MSATTNKILTFSLMIVLLISFPGIASSKKKQGPVWQYGTVSKAAWTEGMRKYIEVDGDVYSFLSDDRIRIARRYKAPGGQWLSESLSLSRVYVGTEVFIRVEGMVIHQLVFEEP